MELLYLMATREEIKLFNCRLLEGKLELDNVIEAETDGMDK